MPASVWAKELKDRLHVRGNAADLVGAQKDLATEWEAFSGSWGRLPVDAFMANGETYRLRRHSVFNVSADGPIESVQAKPYVQPLSINHLNGDVLRTYEPIEPRITGSELFRGLLTGITSVLTEIHGPGTWHHQCFQNRILTSTEQTGNPTPEGMHRDGVDYVVTLLVGRHEVDGGKSGIYEAETRRLIHSETLVRPGDMLIADDERTLHDATPITPREGAAKGWRDVFIDVVTSGTAPR